MIPFYSLARFPAFQGLGTADRTVCRILGCADKQGALKIAAAFERKYATLALTPTPTPNPNPYPNPNPGAGVPCLALSGSLEHCMDCLARFGTAGAPRVLI